MFDSSTWQWWVFPAFFGVLWLAIFYVVARWGGWRSLASVYPSRGTPSGERFRMRSAQLRAGCNYNNCITFFSSPPGLHLSLPFVFRYQHPPMFIPWSELSSREERAWGTPVVVLTAARCPDIPIKLRRHFASRLLSGAGLAAQ